MRFIHMIWNLSDSCNLFIHLQIYKLFKNFKNIFSRVSNNNRNPLRKTEKPLCDPSDHRIVAG